MEVFRQDAGLVRLVLREQHGRFQVLAYLSRYGGLSVFVELSDTFVWQGSNVLEARAWCAAQEEEEAA